jgi:hypothetical protein
LFCRNAALLLKLIQKIRDREIAQFFFRRSILGLAHRASEEFPTRRGVLYA